MRCVVNGAEHVVAGSASRRLIDVLREDLGLTGTKEGCGEGECGSCSVLLDGRLVCSCLVPIGQCDGANVTTIEGVARGDELDHVQRAFAAKGAVQCGACTPGMVLTAHALLDAEERPTPEQIRSYAAGTLCRCTGYEGVLRAVIEVVRARRRRFPFPWRPRGSSRSTFVARARRAMGRAGRQPVSSPGFVRPRSLREALEALAVEEIAVIAGCTDLLARLGREGLPERVLDLTAIEELRRIHLDGDELVLGALTTFADLRRDRNVQRHAPILAEAAATIGATQIQNRATLGGNLVNASPAADSVPPLLALEAHVELSSSRGTRSLPLDAFFVSYRETLRRDGELLTRVRIPLPTPRVQRFRKVGTRAAQAISKVVLAMTVREEPRRVRIGAGSLAPIPLRLRHVESRLERDDWREFLGPRDLFLEPNMLSDLVLMNRSALLAAALDVDVRPIEDVRSTRDYRRHVTLSILTRWLEELASP